MAPKASRRQDSIGSPRRILQLIIIGLLVAGGVLLQFIEAQIVSQQLRRLATSTNQFGMDALKALDKIEPPDKVIVFCPACLSSSFMMIMMGSSKFQVVSSLRHALYVWPLKPHEINKGFKDILEHIGTNSRSTGSKLSLTNLSAAENRAENNNEADYFEPHETSIKSRKLRPQSIAAQSSNRDFLYKSESISQLPWQRLSLPKLMRLRELERAFESPWWHSIGGGNNNNNIRESVGKRQDDNETREARLKQVDSANSTGFVGAKQQEDFNTSQMSVLSNIYLQRGLSMNYNYHLLLRQYYKTVIHPVDFLRNAEETRQHINSLVAANTEGKIRDLVRREIFDYKNISSPKIILISTFHFRGTLDIEMKQKAKPADGQQNNITIATSRARRDSAESRSRRRGRATEQQAIKQTVVDKRKAQTFIETEPSLLKYGHFSSLDCSVIEIPFNDRLVSLIIVMPNSINSTDLLLARMSAQILNDLIGSLVVKRLTLEIPVIKFNRGPINVAGLVRELQLENIFFGDKTYSTETGLNRWMRADDLFHESSIDIGTINPNWTQTEDRLKAGAHSDRAKSVDHVKLDKPFFYFVIDSINSLILTMGRIR